MNFTRITINPQIMHGKPCIRGMRVPVHVILDLLAAGETPANILAHYPYLEADDIAEAIRYAAWVTREDTVPLPPIPA